MQSLHRIGVPTNYGLLWWLAYMLEADRYSDPARSAILPFHELLADPHGDLSVKAK